MKLFTENVLFLRTLCRSLLSQNSISLLLSVIIDWIYTKDYRRMRVMQMNSFTVATVAFSCFAAFARPGGLFCLGFVTPSSGFSIVNKETRSTTIVFPYHGAKGAAAASQSPSSSVADEKQVKKDANAIFSVIDVNGDGTISLEELMVHMKQAGYAEEAVQKVFQKLDVNKDGGISQEEFGSGLMRFSPLRSAPGLGNYNSEFVKEIHADSDVVFASIDTDKSGFISKEELEEHLGRVSKYSPTAIANIFSMIALNESGESSSVEISKNELRDAFVRSSALRQAIGEGPNYK